MPDPGPHGRAGGRGGAVRILIACEFSGAVRRAFRALGHDAWSADLLPAEDGAHHHFIGDVRGILGDGWDMMIAHPPCTYLTCSAEWAYGPGPYHLKVKPGTLVGAERRRAREDAIAFVLDLWNAPIPRICIENPVGVLSRTLAGDRQTIQPYDFGDDASKATCLYLRGLPPLQPTARVAPRMVGGKPRWANQTDGGQNRLSPGPDRWKERSRTYPGIAEAMADQWGALAAGERSAP